MEDYWLCSAFSFEMICSMIFLHNSEDIMKESNDGGQFPRCSFPQRGYSHGCPLVCGNWLGVLGTAACSQVEQRIRQQLLTIVPVLDTFKMEQQPLACVRLRKCPLASHA